ncbi:N-acetylglucosaminyl-phosphatidylinositol de-N-acetylase [Exophiala xenobiotica]|nr:N-acetylglucosaminyl-phosphatidylinositol de-N-acetylase [Exophiala xenobiotica]KAK5204054.1 N-acetylglucosaminyl-phosphatidylinositol de-N-acetylase [Exophiala xenobiotica]KAK5216396.1 N-acetylglucosaminyl-phosphatidylinositol de-N-acetylase [Exophiala xenobiotica]KAK5227587.1 N-acetylglucosaminyl-phosphatidylinositol de-N-acetylase [Exophiala xenobiotica]KAK5249735.1 N-acetylglucosaminyl-phosphatidylinositol de-N-acetylase [Exophiala xenobiotica]
MNTTTLLTLTILPFLLFGLWHITASSVPPIPPSLRGKRIILLIAHPDDESMFFNPTLQALTHPSLQNHLKILCMSTGNADGIGETRRVELEKAAVHLGLRRREDVFVLDDERFKDGMDEDWKPEDIVRVLASAFAPHLNNVNSSQPSSTSTPTGQKDKDRRKSKSKSNSSSKTSSTATAPSAAPTASSQFGPLASIDVLITFDSHGISSHPNHIALFHGASLFVRRVMHGHNGYACPVALYTLPTVNIVRKYSFILDAVPTMLGGIYSAVFANMSNMLSNMSNSGRATTTPITGKKQDRVVFINDFPRYWKARGAMVQGHASQMVWFRWGWIGLGRYMVVNDLRAEKIAAS